VTTRRRTIATALFVCLMTPLGAAPQEGTAPPDSVERIRKALDRPAELRPRFDTAFRVPAATFKSRVDQQVFVPTLDEWLAKEFKLNLLQRQSAEWAGKCCGIGLDPLLEGLDQALKRRRVRKVRQQIARELAALGAVDTKTANVPDKH
jgi:hypothetical protein